MAPRTGRPVSGNAKNESLHLRLSKEQKEKIKKCAELLKTSTTDAILYSIDESLKNFEK